MRYSAFSSMLLLGLSGARAAIAADPEVRNTDSRVILKDGSVVHGEVKEPPAHRVTVDGPGKRLVIPTENVHVIEEAPPRAFVSFEAGGDAAVLEEERAGNWQPVCTAPCQKDLPLDATYRISGAGIRNSNGFRLNAAPGDRLRLTADTASSTVHTLGMVMLVGSASVGSLAFWFLDLAADAQSYDSRSSDRQMGTAVVTILVSAVVGAVGLGLVLGTQTTSAKQELVVPKARDQAFTPRLPTWSEARPRSEPELRPPPTASLFTVHF